MAMAIHWCIFLTLASLAGLCYPYPSYRDRIPNGHKVPNPCKPGQFWAGVGHWSEFGKNERNPFGLAFKAANKSWTMALCRSDSDGDGRTNGEELGDPSCKWKIGATPEKDTGLSHPGICEQGSKTCTSRTVAVVCGSVFGPPSKASNGLVKYKFVYLMVTCIMMAIIH